MYIRQRVYIFGCTCRSVYIHKQKLLSAFVFTGVRGQWPTFIAMREKVMEVKSIQALNEVLWKKKID